MAGCKARFLLVLSALLALAGCGPSDNSGGAGGVTAGEAEALNEAAAMLDQRADNARAALADEKKNEGEAR